jgi:hypothetical protein
MPQPDEGPQANLRDGLTVADVAEVLDRDERLQLRAHGVASAADGEQWKQRGDQR